MKTFKKIMILCVIVFLSFSTVCMASDAVPTSDDNALEDGTMPISDDETTPEEGGNSSMPEQSYVLNIVNNDLYLAQESVVINEPINGNAFVVANDVTINSEINGDLFVFAKSLTINEKAIVYNNLFAFASDISIAGSVYDVYAACGNFSLEQSGYIYRDLKVGCDKVTLNGMVKKDAYLSASTILVPEDAQNIIGGNLHYVSNSEMIFPENAVGGETTFTLATKHEKTTSERIANAISNFIATIALMITVILLATFFAPKFINKSHYVMTKNAFATAGIGVLAFVLIPVISFIGMMTGLLASVGIALLVLYGLILSITLTILSMAIAKTISIKLKMETKGKFILLSIATAIVIWLLQRIPYIGGYISLFTLVFGLGQFLFAFFSKKGAE